MSRSGTQHCPIRVPLPPHGPLPLPIPCLHPPPCVFMPCPPHQSRLHAPFPFLPLVCPPLFRRPLLGRPSLLVPSSPPSSPARLGWVANPLAGTHTHALHSTHTHRRHQLTGAPARMRAGPPVLPYSLTFALLPPSLRTLLPPDFFKPTHATSFHMSNPSYARCIAGEPGREAQLEGREGQPFGGRRKLYRGRRRACMHASKGMAGRAARVHVVVQGGAGGLATGGGACRKLGD